MKQVTKCLRQCLSWCNQTGLTYDSTQEQYWSFWELLQTIRDACGRSEGYMERENWQEIPRIWYSNQKFTIKLGTSFWWNVPVNHWELRRPSLSMQCSYTTGSLYHTIETIPRKSISYLMLQNNNPSTPKCLSRKVVTNHGMFQTVLMNTLCLYPLPNHPQSGESS